MDSIRCKVIGDCEIAGVATGGIVELDPETVNIDALVAGGHIEVLPVARKSGKATQPEAGD